MFNKTESSFSKTIEYSTNPESKFCIECVINLELILNSAQNVVRDNNLNWLCRNHHS